MWYREGLEFDYQHIIDDFILIATHMGFSVNAKDVSFSGFYVQGSGASFAGSWCAEYVNPGGTREHAPNDEELHKIAEVFEREHMDWKLGFDPNAPPLTNEFRISHGNGYGRSFTMNFEPGLQSETGEQEHLYQATRALAHWLYRTLESEYEYQMDDEQIDGLIQINEYEFNEQGERDV